MKITKKTVVVRAKNAIYKDINDVVYVLDHKTATIHTLNDTASYIWRLLRKPHTVQSLITKVTTAFDVDNKSASLHIISFIEKYVKAGLLECV